ncbi:MAG TPA: PQQ-binding-like beta-propeller repeat protein [Gemmataceae bacterium]|nr:PQQ-binding-like beta-propeller repeat protein [Gemmataceae bacterium]
MNERRFAVAGGLIAVLLFGLAAPPARAVIEALIPLETLIHKQSEFIFTAKVDKIDPDKPGVVLEAGDALKGKAPFTRLPVNLTGDDYAKEHQHTPQLLKRLAPKLPVVLFVVKRDKRYVALGYSNGTWFQMTAEADAENPVWAFTHCEPYLRRTFKGTTDEMRTAVADSLAGKAKAPEPDRDEKPGLGPEVEPKKTQPPVAGGAPDGPLFAVVPTVAIGGLLSLLAMLFPAVFGGLTGQLKRWTAVISVASLNSTLLFLHGWLAPRWSGSWWATKMGLWVIMTVVTALGVLWAWRRQLTALTRPEPPAEKASSPGGTTAAPGVLPTRYEQALLLILSGLGVALFGVCLLLGYPLLSLPWSFVLALWVGIWAGTLYVVWVRRTAARPRSQPAFTSEGVVLWAMVPACLALGCSSAPVGVFASAQGAGAGAVRGEEATRGAHFLKETPINFAPGVAGAVDARVLIDGDRLFVAVAYPPDPFSTSGTPGNLYCVDRSTGAVRWDFNRVNGSVMREVFSSPCLADGKLYVGEGFHDDARCNLYCIDADTGKQLWAHPTASHTESSPCVAGGKVYCGAGDEGLICLDPGQNGKRLWQYAKGHIDCPPLVVGQRVYCGAGVDRNLKGPQETAIFCLDAETGEEVWRVKTDLPAWGKPFVSGDRAFFPLGNGDSSKPVSPPAKPAGAVLCVSAADGQQVWRFDVGDGVLEGPAVDAGQVYFGSRDGHCYCVGRDDGRLRWERDLGSPVVASPALAVCSSCGTTNSVYALARDGRAACLDSASGRVMWQREFSAAQLLSPPVVTVEHTPQGDRRSVYFGAGILGNNQIMVYCLEDQWKDE